MIQPFLQLQNEPKFKVIDDTQRADLALRKEIKFSLPNADVGKLRAVLARSCKQVIHHRPVSTVRSVYFDTPRLGACHANLNGHGVRNKLRVRWYDQLCPGKKFFVEIKWRKSRLTGKHRLGLQSENPLGEMSYAHIQQGFTDCLPIEFQTMMMRYPDPIALVEYKREHFVCLHHDIRLTIDYDLVFYDQCGKSCISTSFGQRLQGAVILEAKMPPGKERHLNSLLAPMPARVTRFSKYVHACSTLGLIASEHSRL